MSRRLLTITALSCAASLLATMIGAAYADTASAAQRTVSISATEGPVTAALSYKLNPGGPFLITPQLQISKGGVRYYSASVRPPACQSACALEPLHVGPLKVKELENNGQQQVVLELNTGGAHCCSLFQIYVYDPGSSTYRVVEHNFGDPGALLTDISGDERLEFESADDRFAYAFTSFAFSGLPLQIWRFSEGRFVDATRQFPKAVAADAKRQFGGFLANRRRGYGLGAIAAWAADEYLLGNGARVSSTLAREARLHRLSSADHLSPGGSRFVRKLQSFLGKTGYAPAS